MGFSLALGKCSFCSDKSSMWPQRWWLFTRMILFAL
jgi:hypothetical protein